MQPLLTSDPPRVGDYRSLARLGKGSMGAVYLARSRGGRVVAIKLVRPDLAEDAEFRERFRREVDMARSVGGFWTAAVVAADTDAEQPWLATEYIPGPTLHRAVADHGGLPEDTVRTLASGLAEALGAVHQAGLVHRDLKPANVLLGPDGPRVIDFGISRAMTGHALTATGMFLGTPGYFSPEQTLGTEIGAASDVFSLGAVLVFAATGRGPFGEESTAAMLYRVVHAEPDVTGVPERLQPLLAACLAKDPASRPTTSQLLDELGEVTPRGDHWLPPSITAVISEHTTQLQHTVNNAPPDTPPPSQVQANSGTRSHTSAQDQSETPEAPPANPNPVAGAANPEAPAPSPGQERRGDIRRAAPRRTAQQALAGQRPLVRKDEPGPVFATGGRFVALLSALVLGLIVVAAVMLVGQPGHDLGVVYAAGLGLLSLSAVLSLVKVFAPGLRMKVNNDGLRVSRARLAREVPWTYVSRTGIVGKGKNQVVAVWFNDTAPPAKSRAWHRIRSYHGGAQMFPIGTTGGWWKRRQETKRVRTALQQYGRGTYDGRLL